MKSLQFGDELIHFVTGTIRDAGGAFGKRQVAHEEQYFRRQQIKQMEKLKEMLAKEDQPNEPVKSLSEDAVDEAFRKPKK